MPTLTGFATWTDVLQHAASGARIWYQAPLDFAPQMVLIRKVFKNGKMRVDPANGDADVFTADSEHLNRFRKLAR